MISKVRPSFWRAYDRLTSSVKARAREAWRVFDQYPDHPSLRFKKLQSRHDRAVGVRSGDTIEWIWIGTHNEFDNLFS